MGDNTHTTYETLWQSLKAYIEHTIEKRYSSARVTQIVDATFTDFEELYMNGKGQRYDGNDYVDHALFREFVRFLKQNLIPLIEKALEGKEIDISKVLEDSVVALLNDKMDKGGYSGTGMDLFNLILGKVDKVPGRRLLTEEEIELLARLAGFDPTQNQQDIKDVLERAKDYTDTLLSGVGTGSINLVDNSNFDQSTTFLNVLGGTSGIDNSIFRFVSDGSSNGYISIPIDLKAGLHTFAFKMRNSKPCSLKNFQNVNSGYETTLSSSDAFVVHKINFTVTADGPTELRIYLDNPIQGDFIELDWIMIAEGDVEAVWVPSTQDIQHSLLESKAEMDRLRSLLQGEINDVSESLNDFESDFRDFSSDGIYDIAEYAAIEKYLNTLIKEKEDIDRVYTNLVNNPNLLNKTPLTQAYNNYDQEHNRLITEVNRIVSDRIATPEEKVLIDDLFNDYRIALNAFNIEVDNALDAISAKKEADIKGDILSSVDEKIAQYRIDFNGEIQDILNAFDLLKNKVDEIVLDGVVTDAELAVLRNELEKLDREKSDLIGRYENILLDDRLTGANRDALVLLKGDYESAHEALKDVINLIVSDGIVTDAEKSELSNKFKEYATALGSFTVGIDKAISTVTHNTITAEALSVLNDAKAYTDQELTRTRAEIDELIGALGGLEGGLDDALSDKVLSVVEIEGLKTDRDTLIKEKEDVDAKYVAYMSNPRLVDDVSVENDPRDLLEDKYNIFNSEYTQLIDKFNTYISDGVINDVEKADLDSRINNARNAATMLRTAFENATKEIYRNISEEAEANLNSLKEILGTLAQTGMVEIAMLGDTIIEGGYIKSELLDIENIILRGSLLTTHDSESIVSEAKAEAQALVEANNSAFRSEVSQQITDALQSVDGLQQTVETIVSDSVVNIFEVSKINDAFTNMEAENIEIIGKYNNIYNNPLLEEPNKGDLRSAKDDFVSRYDFARDLITEKIEDGVVSEQEKTEINAAIYSYAESLATLTVLFGVCLDSINEARAYNAKTEAINAAQENLNTETTLINQEIEGLRNSLTLAESKINEYTGDGFIDKMEAVNLKGYLRTLITEKADVDEKMNLIYSNARLKGEAKTTLYDKHIAFVDAHNNLKTLIELISAEGAITETQSVDLETKFATYNTAIVEMRTAFENAIDSIRAELNIELKAYTNNLESRVADIAFDGKAQLARLAGELELKGGYIGADFIDVDDLRVTGSVVVRSDLDGVRDYAGQIAISEATAKANLAKEQALAEAEAKAKNYTDTQLSLINTEITDVKSAIDALQGGIDDAVNNGDIDATKIPDIEAKRDALIAQKNNIEPIYNEVYNDTNLAGMPKTELGTEKSELDTTHTELITAINNAIQAGKVEGAEKTAIDAKFDTYSADITALHTALENALNEIESEKIAQAEADAQAQIDALQDTTPEWKELINYSFENDFYMARCTKSVFDGVMNLTYASGRYNSYGVSYGYEANNLVGKSLKFLITAETDDAKPIWMWADEMNGGSLIRRNKIRFNTNIGKHTYALEFAVGENIDALSLAFYVQNTTPIILHGGFVVEEQIDDVQDNSAEIDAINNAKQQAIQEAQDYTSAKNAVIDTELGLLETKLIDLKTSFNGAISGVGVITPSENASIEATTNLLKVEKKDIDSKYSEIYSNEKLTGTHKANLSTAKTEFDTASAELINAINSSISDANVTPGEKTDIDSKFDVYGSKLSNLRSAFEQAIKSIEETKIEEAKNNAVNTSNAYTDGQLSDLQTQMQATQDAIAGFNADFDNAVLDGVIDRTEKIVIEKHIRIIEETMGRASSSYSKVYTNPFLTGSAKTSLQNAKINLWGKRDELISTINSAISNNSVTQGEKDLVDQKFGYFNTAMGAFQSALEEAHKTIQANIKAQTEANAETIAENKANEVVDDVEFGSVNLLNGTKEFVQAVSQGVVTSTSGRTYYKYGYGWGFRISSSNIEKMVIGKEYTISIDVYNPSSNNTTARIIYSGNHNYIDIGGELETTASITFVYQNETPDIRFLTSDPNLPPVYWGFPILTKGNRPTAWQSSEADKQINIDQAKDQAMDNIAKKIGYSDYSDMVAKALAKGPLVDVQGLLNAEIVNAEAVWAKIIEATLVVANKIVSQNNGFSVAINAFENSPFVTTWPTGEPWEETIYSNDRMRKNYKNRAGDVVFYIDSEEGMKFNIVEEKWINREFRSLGSTKSGISRSDFGTYRDSSGNAKYNVNGTDYFEYVSASIQGNKENPDEDKRIYKSKSKAPSNKIPDGYYYSTYQMSSLISKALLDQSGSPQLNANDIQLSDAFGDWYSVRCYKIVSGKITETFYAIIQIR